MPLRHVLYRCPRCGHDPTEGQGDGASCPACGATFVRRSRGVEVRDAGGAVTVSVAELVDAIEAHGGPLTAAQAPDGRVRFESPVRFHGFVHEEPIRAGGRLLGFVERPGPPEEGVLCVDEEALTFRGREERRWRLEDVTALQVSSRSLQLGIRGRGTLQVTFPEASTYRWEGLLQHLIRALWQERGWGEITEFQPRITGR